MYVHAPYNHGCQVGSIRHKLSAFEAAWTSWVILFVSDFSKCDKLLSRVIIETTALLTTAITRSVSTSTAPDGRSWGGVPSGVFWLAACSAACRSSRSRFLCSAMISSLRMARRMAGSWSDNKEKFSLFACLNHQKKSNSSTYLEVRLDQASCCCNRWCRQRPIDANVGQIFHNVWSESEWDESISVQLACCLIHVKFKVGNVDQPRVLVQVHHVGIETRQVQGVFQSAGKRELQSKL